MVAEAAKRSDVVILGRGRSTDNINEVTGKSVIKRWTDSHEVQRPPHQQCPSVILLLQYIAHVATSLVRGATVSSSNIPSRGRTLRYGMKYLLILCT